MSFHPYRRIPLPNICDLLQNFKKTMKNPAVRNGRIMNQYAMVVISAYSGWETSRREDCTTMG